MNIQNFWKKINPSKHEDTQLSNDFDWKDYGEKVILKNSMKWNLAFLIFGVLISIYLLSNIADHKNKWLTITFCLIFLIYPIIKLLDQGPLLTISTEGIILRTGQFITWKNIKATKIEELISDNPSYRLQINYDDDKSVIIDLTDLNYSRFEISHIIEYFKKRNNAS